LLLPESHDFFSQRILQSPHG